MTQHLGPIEGTIGTYTAPAITVTNATAKVCPNTLAPSAIINATVTGPYNLINLNSATCTQTNTSWGAEFDCQNLGNGTYPFTVSADFGDGDHQCAVSAPAEVVITEEPPITISDTASTGDDVCPTGSTGSKQGTLVFTFTTSVAAANVTPTLNTSGVCTNIVSTNGGRNWTVTCTGVAAGTHALYINAYSDSTLRESLGRAPLASNLHLPLCPFWGRGSVRLVLLREVWAPACPFPPSSSFLNLFPPLPRRMRAPAQSV